MPMYFKKREAYEALVNKEAEEPSSASSSTTTTPTATAATEPTEPTTAAEWLEFDAKLRQKAREAEALQAQVAAEIQNLAPRVFAGDAQAMARLEELKAQALKIQADVRLLADAQLEVVRKLTQAEAFESQAAADAKRSEFERLLRESLFLAEQSDQHLANYAEVMNQRQQLLMTAQGLAATSEERARVMQLLGRQGVSWQMGFYGIPKFIDQADFMFHRDFNTLSNFTRARLTAWGVSAPEPAPTAEPTVKKQLVN